MQAGPLDQRVFLFRNTPTRDRFGGLVDHWTGVTAGGVAAAYLPVSDAELTRGDQQQIKVTDRFQIRWSTRVKDVEPATWRLTWRGVTYDIIRSKPLGQRNREFLELSCAAGAVKPA